MKEIKSFRVLFYYFSRQFCLLYYISRYSNNIIIELEAMQQKQFTEKKQAIKQKIITKIARIKEEQRQKTSLEPLIDQKIVKVKVVIEASSKLQQKASQFNSQKTLCKNEEEEHQFIENGQKSLKQIQVKQISQVQVLSQNENDSGQKKNVQEKPQTETEKKEFQQNKPIRMKILNSDTLKDNNRKNEDQKSIQKPEPKLKINNSSEGSYYQFNQENIFAKYQLQRDLNRATSNFKFEQENDNSESSQNEENEEYDETLDFVNQEDSDSDFQDQFVGGQAIIEDQTSRVEDKEEVKEQKMIKSYQFMDADQKSQYFKQLQRFYNSLFQKYKQKRKIKPENPRRVSFSNTLSFKEFDQKAKPNAIKSTKEKRLLLIEEIQFEDHQPEEKKQS